MAEAVKTKDLDGLEYRLRFPEFSSASFADLRANEVPCILQFLFLKVCFEDNSTLENKKKYK